jgi:hypothetical protein
MKGGCQWPSAGCQLPESSGFREAKCAVGGIRQPRIFASLLLFLPSNVSEEPGRDWPGYSVGGGCRIWFCF